MRLIYPMLTLVSLLLVSLPAIASPIAIATSSNWAKVAIAGGVVLAVIGLSVFSAWITIKWPTKKVLSLMFIMAGLIALAVFVHLYLSL